MSFHRSDDLTVVDTTTQSEVEIEDRARIRYKAKNKSAKASRNRSPGRNTPTPAPVTDEVVDPLEVTEVEDGLKKGKGLRGKFKETARPGKTGDPKKVGVREVQTAPLTKEHSQSVGAAKLAKEQGRSQNKAVPRK